MTSGMVSLRGRLVLADVWYRWMDGLRMRRNGSAAEDVTQMLPDGSAAEDVTRWRSVCFARKGELPGRSCDRPTMACLHYPDDSLTQNCGSAAEDVTPRPNCGSDLTAC